MEFIGNEKYGRKGAELADSHDVFSSCGWVIQENELVIDIDCLEKSVIEKMIDIFNINTQIVF